MGWLKDDKYEGKGKYYFNRPDETREEYHEFYEGEWKDGKRHGEGTFRKEMLGSRS